MGRELNAFVGRKVITMPLDAIDNIVKTDKLACVTKMVFSLGKFDITNNLKEGSLSNILPRYHMIGSEEFMHFEPVRPQHRRLRNREFTSVTL